MGCGGHPHYGLQTPAQNQHVPEHSRALPDCCLSLAELQTQGCPDELKLRSPRSLLAPGQVTTQHCTRMGGLPAAPSPACGGGHGAFSNVSGSLGFERVCIERMMIKGLGEVSVMWTGFYGASPLSSPGVLVCPGPPALGCSGVRALPQDSA